MELAFALQIQAYFDGELPADKRRLLERSIHDDPQAVALLAELQSVRCLVASAPERKTPESREFYWSKIERTIAQQKAGSKKRRWIIWSLFGAPACALIALIFSLVHPMEPLTEQYAGGDNFIYRDEEAQTTVIWFNFPSTIDRPISTGIE
jgi:anti-sigma factor RsiW